MVKQRRKDDGAGKESSTSQAWFCAKKFGYGWRPVAWQGWLLLLMYVVYLTGTFIRVDSHSHSVSDTLIGIFPRFVLATILLIWICVKTGEKPGWHWGT